MCMPGAFLEFCPLKLLPILLTWMDRNHRSPISSQQAFCTLKLEFKQKGWLFGSPCHLLSDLPVSPNESGEFPGMPLQLGSHQPGAKLEWGCCCSCHRSAQAGPCSLQGQNMPQNQSHGRPAMRVLGGRKEHVGQLWRWWSLLRSRPGFGTWACDLMCGLGVRGWVTSDGA